MRAAGVNGQLTLNDSTLTISREGFLAFLTQGLKGDKSIAIEHITSIQFKPAGALVRGYIQFAFMGGQEAKGGAFQAANDENSVVFTDEQETDFRRLKLELERRISLARQPAAPVVRPSSSLDDLERLANLRDRGILTDEEFAAKKRQILNS